MATPWKVAAATAVVGWFVSPLITLLLPKILSRLGFEASEKLRDLKIHIIPELETTLRAVNQERMMERENKMKSVMDALDEMACMLRHAREDAEDIFDDAEHKIVTRSWHRLRGAAATCTACCNRLCAWIAHVFRNAIRSRNLLEEPRPSPANENQGASHGHVKVNDSAAASSHQHAADLEASKEEEDSDATTSSLANPPGTQLAPSLSSPSHLLGHVVSEAAPLDSSLEVDAVLEVAPLEYAARTGSGGPRNFREPGQMRLGFQHFHGIACRNRICGWIAHIFQSAFGSRKSFEQPVMKNVQVNDSAVASHSHVQVNDSAAASSRQHAVDIEASKEEEVSDVTTSSLGYPPGTQLVPSLSAPSHFSGPVVSEVAPSDSGLEVDEAVLEVAPSDYSAKTDSGRPKNIPNPPQTRLSCQFFQEIACSNKICMSIASIFRSAIGSWNWFKGHGPAKEDQGASQGFVQANDSTTASSHQHATDSEGSKVEAVSDSTPSSLGYPPGTQLVPSLSAPSHLLGHVVSEVAPLASGLEVDEAMLEAASSHQHAAHIEASKSDAATSSLGYPPGTQEVDEAVLEAAPSDYSARTDCGGPKNIPNPGQTRIGCRFFHGIAVENHISQSLHCWQAWVISRSIWLSKLDPPMTTPEETVSQATHSHSASVLVRARSRLCIFFDFIMNWLVDMYEKARVQRDFSYEGTGITINRENATALDFVLTAISRRNLKKRIEKIESIVSAVKRSPLLVEARKSAPEDVANKNRSKIRIASNLKVFGREMLRDYIMAKLRETPQVNGTTPCYSVISIYGLAGSGKTTFARYTRDCVEKECKKDKVFDTIMCIHLSQSFSVTDIFHEMLKDITEDRHSGISDREDLEDKLKDSLSGKRFFLILDDLWSTNKSDTQLQELLSPLNVGRTGSKILVTTRKKGAARALSSDEPIKMPYLDEDQYFSMFRHYAFGDTSVADEFVSVGREIAKKLHRSPIAAAIVAGRLGTNPDIRFWKSTANLDMMGDTMDALWWSYQQLNPDIRRCLEYCKIFPRRRRLRRDELVHLWGAQGFLKTIVATEDMEDVAECYLQELVSCSFLQSEETSNDTDCFTVHDLLHDLVDIIAGSDCITIENATCHVGEGWKEVPRDVRHAFIQEYDPQLISMKILELVNLRTLIIGVSEYSRRVEEEVIDSICKKLPKLRVLSIALSKGCSSVKEKTKFSVPDSVGQLKHLRYFSLTEEYNGEINLPSTLNKLQHIQLLDFSRSNILEFTFSELVNLRHIFCTTPVKLPYVGRLSSLQTIPDFIVSNEQGCELKQLRDLNKIRGCLEIRGLENVKSKKEALEANLASKEQLTELVLQWGSVAANTRCSPEVEVEVFEGMCPPVGLQKLRISGYEGSYPYWMMDKHYGGPKDLQQLWFSRCSQRGPVPQLVEAFPRLSVLMLWYCSWDALPDNMEDLTFLKKLDMYSCKNIRFLPRLPRSLEKFELYSCNDELKESLKEVGHENWKKIMHIPTRFIY